MDLKRTQGLEMLTELLAYIVPSLLLVTLL